MNPVFDAVGAQWDDGLAEIEALLEANDADILPPGVAAAPDWSLGPTNRGVRLSDGGPVAPVFKHHGADIGAFQGETASGRFVGDFEIIHGRSSLVLLVMTQG